MESFLHDDSKFSGAATGTVTVVPADRFEVKAWVVTPGGEDRVVITEGQTRTFPLGVEVHVSALPAEGEASGWFREWSAPGSTLTGSPNATDQFLLTGGIEVTAVERGIESFEHSNDIISWVAGGRAPLLVGRAEGALSTSIIYVREGTLVGVKTSPISYATWGTRLSFITVYNSHEANHERLAAVLNPPGDGLRGGRERA